MSRERVVAALRACGQRLWDGEDVWTRDEQGWEALLREEEEESLTLRESEVSALEAAIGVLLSVVRGCNECYVGGEGSTEHGPCLLQILGVCDDVSGEVDLVTSVLLPGPQEQEEDGERHDEVDPDTKKGSTVAFTERGTMKVLRAWWRWYPAAPVVVDCGESFERVLCEPESGEPGGPLSFAEVRRCRMLSSRETPSRLRVLLPKHPTSSKEGGDL